MFAVIQLTVVQLNCQEKKYMLYLSKEWFEAKHILYCTFKEVISISGIVIA